MSNPVFIKTSDVVPDYGAMEIVTAADIGRIDEFQTPYYIISSSSAKAALDAIGSIRKSARPDTYLKPVVFLLEEHEKKNVFHHGADTSLYASEYNSKSHTRMLDKFGHINRWIERLDNSDEKLDVNLAFKLLRFIASRDAELTPTATAANITGYSYPSIEPFFEYPDISILHTLDYLEEQKLLSTERYCKAHLCSNCYCAFLNFEECCTDCGSDDLNVEELVHHFKCAYTAEMSDFMKNGALVCPKCDRHLKHIGVDYDKPSIMYQCNQCSLKFQNPDIISSCYNCHRKTEPENQIIKEIKSYKLTSIGNNSALFGLDSLFSSILDKKLNLFTVNQFEEFLNVEKARITRYKLSTSSLVILNFHNLDKLYLRIGHRTKDLFGELSAIFRNMLRPSDVISAKNESIFMIIMTETGTEHAGIAVRRLREAIDGLFAENLDTSIELKLTIEQIDLETSLDNQIESVLKDSAD